jgi:hypothetical protein
MKELKTHKDMRGSVSVHGFKPIAFAVFLVVGVFSIIALFGDFSYKSVLVTIGINTVSFIITKIVISNEAFSKGKLNEKFPKEITDLTKTKEMQNSEYGHNGNFVLGYRLTLPTKFSLGEEDFDELN